MYEIVCLSVMLCIHCINLFNSRNPPAFEECLRALTSCGCDIDAAISWLCESPNSGDSTDKSHSENAYLNESNGIDGNDNTFLDNTKKRVEAELQQMMAAAAKAKKDADHKEELRRINRAWNIRAEGEKKRLEMEKRHREVEKQRMTLAAQKISRPPSSEGSGGYIPSYTSQVYPNTIHFDRNIDSSTICGSNGQNRSSFSVMEQQYFPPLSSDKCSQMALIHSQGTTYLQEGGKEQTLISHQSSRLHLESALVDTNPELSIDGLNKGAKEFVPKFSVTSAVLDMQNDIIPSQLLCRHEQGKDVI